MTSKWVLFAASGRPVEVPKVATTAKVSQVHFGPRPCVVLKTTWGRARYPVVPHTSPTMWVRMPGQFATDTAQRRPRFECFSPGPKWAGMAKMALAGAAPPKTHFFEIQIVHTALF